MKGVTTGYMSLAVSRGRGRKPRFPPQKALLLDMAENKECLGKSIVTSHRIPWRMSHLWEEIHTYWGFLVRTEFLFLQHSLPFSIQSKL